MTVWPQKQKKKTEDISSHIIEVDRYSAKKKKNGEKKKKKVDKIEWVQRKL